MFAARFWAQRVVWTENRNNRKHKEKEACDTPTAHQLGARDGHTVRVSWGAGDTGAMLITSRNFDDRKTTEIISIEQQLPDQARLDGGAAQVRRAAAATADLVAQLRR